MSLLLFSSIVARCFPSAVLATERNERSGVHEDAGELVLIRLKCRAYEQGIPS
jgi:hypothetical protein